MTTVTDTMPTVPTPTTGTDDLAALVQTGTTALKQGDLTAALESFEAVVDRFPDQPEGHNNLGALYTSLGDFARAEICFEKVLTIMPDNTNVLFNRGVIRTRLEKLDGARTDFQAVLKATPDDADAHNNLGVTSFMQGHFKHARRCFGKALKLRPDNANALLNLCDVAVACGNSAEAIELCQDFSSRHDCSDVNRRLLDLLDQRCREALEQASRAAEKVLVGNSADEDTRLRLGRLMQAKASLGD